MAKPQASFIHKLQERLANDPVKRILLAKEYAIEDWLLGAYEQLVSRKELITVEGVSTLGLDCIVKIARVREWVLTERIRRLGGERRGGIFVLERDHPDMLTIRGGNTQLSPSV